jgi:hypothetical protein
MSGSVLSGIDCVAVVVCYRLAAYDAAHPPLWLAVAKGWGHAHDPRERKMSAPDVRRQTFCFLSGQSANVLADGGNGSHQQRTKQIVGMGAR